MSWDDLSDLAITAAQDTMGRPYVYRASGGVAVSSDGVYRNPYRRGDADRQVRVGVESTVPTLKVRQRDFPAGHPAQGAEVDVEGLDGAELAYFVDGVQSQHVGSVLLDLVER